MDDLARHADFLRRIARALLADHHAAEDAVQESYAALLRRRGPSPRRPVAWLVAAVRNFARMGRRGEERRRAHERLGARANRTSPPDEHLERLEIQERLVRAVRELDEPYREAVMLRYFEGLPAREIAKRLGIPVATVRTRLQRALAQLRGRLDRSGDRESWAPLLVPLLGSRGGIARVALTCGGLLMKTNVVVAVAVAALLGVLVLSRSRGPTERAPDGGDALVPVADAAPGSTAAPAEHADAGAGPPGDARRSAKFVRILAVAEDPVIPGDARATVATENGEREAEGRAALGVPLEIDVASLLEGDPPSGLQVGVDHPLYLPALTRIARGDGPCVGEARLELVRAGAVGGRVADEQGSPVAGAAVALFGESVREPVDQVETDKEGRFHLRAAQDGTYWMIALARDREAAGGQVTVRVGHVATLDAPLVLGAGATIRGRVTDSSGSPLEDAEVQAEPPGDGRVFTLRGDIWGESVRTDAASLVRSKVRAMTGPDGTYVLAGLAARRHAVSCTSALLGTGLRSEPRITDAPADSVDLVVPCATVDVTVTAEGGPLPAMVEIGRAPAPGCWTHQGSGADDRGSIRWRVPVSTPLTVRVTHPGFRERTEALPGIPAGEARVLTIDLVRSEARATLALAVEVGEGELPAVVSVGFCAEGASDSERSAARKDGAYRIENLEPGAYRLTVRAGDSLSLTPSFLADGETDAVLTAGQETRARVRLSRGGHVRLWVASREGRPLAPNCDVIDEAGAESALGFCGKSAHGNLCSRGNGIPQPPTLEPYDSERALLPGRYMLRLSEPGYLDLALPVAIEAGRLTEVRATMEPRR